MFLGFLLFGVTSGIRDGWLVVKWSQLFYQVGFTEVDPEKPLDWSEFFLGWLEKTGDKSTSD